MASLQTLKSFLDEYLLIGKTGQVESISDNSWNGLQVDAGSDEVQKIALAVDAGLSTFELAAKAGAQLLLTHHGIFWQGSDPSFNGYTKDRVTFLLENKISLYSAHLPLDVHPEIGNNVQTLKLLGAVPTKTFGSKSEPVGWVGELEETTGLTGIVTKLAEGLPSQPMVLDFGPQEIRTIAVISGGGNTADFYAAMATGADVYITGEAREVYHVTKDMKKNVIFAGHNATETIGVKALGKVLQEKFAIETGFIPFPTGI